MDLSANLKILGNNSINPESLSCKNKNIHLVANFKKNDNRKFFTDFYENHWIQFGFQDNYTSPTYYTLSSYLLGKMIFSCLELWFNILIVL